MSYFEYVPLEITLKILDSGECLSEFIFAYSHVREQLISEYIKFKYIELYKFFDRLIKDLNVTWYDSTFYLLIRTHINAKLTLREHHRVALEDFRFNWENYMTVDSRILSSQSSEYNTSVCLYILSSSGEATAFGSDTYTIVLNKICNPIYNYIKDKGLHKKYGLSIFSWIYGNIMHDNVNNIKICPDLERKESSDILKIISTSKVTLSSKRVKKKDSDDDVPGM